MAWIGMTQEERDAIVHRVTVHYGIIDLAMEAKAGHTIGASIYPIPFSQVNELIYGLIDLSKKKHKDDSFSLYLPSALKDKVTLPQFVLNKTHEGKILYWDCPIITGSSNIILFYPQHAKPDIREAVFKGWIEEPRERCLG